MLNAHQAVRVETRPVARAIAQRDGTSLDFENTAREVQARLYGRSAVAKYEAPANVIFDGGLGALTTADVDDKEEAYRQFIRRIEDNLPATDAVRIEFLPVLKEQLEAFQAAEEAIKAANVDLKARKDELALAITAWETVMIETYGLLFAELGKKKAGRYFRKTARKLVQPPNEAATPKETAKAAPEETDESLDETGHPG